MTPEEWAEQLIRIDHFSHGSQVTIGDPVRNNVGRLVLLNGHPRQMDGPERSLPAQLYPKEISDSRSEAPQ